MLRIFFCILIYLSNNKLLDEYIKKPEKNFQYQIISEHHTNSSLFYKIEVITLTILDIDWNVSLTCTFDSLQKINMNPVVLMVSNNKNSRDVSKLRTISGKTNSLVCEMSTIPYNKAYNDLDIKKQDDIHFLSYSMKKFMDSNSSEYLIHFPCVKSIIKVMDVIESVINRKFSFIIQGEGILRGFSTYLIGAVDDRVVGILPTFVDINLKEVLLQTWAKLCYWPEDFVDFNRRGILFKLDEPIFMEYVKNIDPYYFIDRILVPKYIILSAGDEFFSTYNSNKYFHLLKGNNYLHFVPNLEINDIDVDTMVTNFVTFLNSGSKPLLKWNSSKIHTNNLLINVTFIETPISARLWTAQNENSCDFRFSNIGKKWRGFHIDVGGHLSVEIEKLNQGWKSGFIQFEYEKFSVSTFVYTVPKTYPCNTPPKKYIEGFIVISIFVLLFFFIVMSYSCYIAWCIISRIKDKILDKKRDSYIRFENMEDEKSGEGLIIKNKEKISEDGKGEESKIKNEEKILEEWNEK